MTPDLHEPLVDRPTVGRVFDARRRVRLADSSPAGRLRLDATARYLQDIANDDSRDAGSPNPTAWVARRTVMRIVEFPEYLDALSLSTWCSGLGPRWAERRYSVLADAPSAGRIEASTLWVHVDMATMKPVPVPADFAEQFGAAAHGRIVKARLHLPLRPPPNNTGDQVGDEAGGQEAGGQTVSVWPLRFVDFDVLGHVNNSVYWAMVEEQLASRRWLRAPLTVTLEHHDGIDPGEDVRVTVRDTSAGFDLWVATTSGKVTAVVRATAG